MNISEVQRAGEGPKIVRSEINKWMDREVKHRKSMQREASIQIPGSMDKK